MPPCPRGHQAPGGGTVTRRHAWRNPRPLAIGSASHYAQEHDLTVDFYVESSERAASHLVSLNADSQHMKGKLLTSYSHLTQCTIPASSIEDHWLDTEQSVEYLQQLHSSLDSLGLQCTYLLEPKQLSATKSRCELPVLRSDNNLDLFDLAYGIYSRRASALAEISIPPIEIDPSGDDGLQFPCWSHQLMRHFDSYLPKETIQNPEVFEVPEYAVLYSATDISDPDKEATSGLIEGEFNAYKQGRV